MLSSFLALFFSGLFFSLRLGPGSGSFPRPLRAEEEARAVEAWVSRGDTAARNELVEHNLRLVAHSVKKYYRRSGGPHLHRHHRSDQRRQHLPPG